LHNTGGASVADSKRIIVNVPDSLLKEIDDAVCIECRNRSEFIRNAAKFYLKEIKKINMVEIMMKGYLEMANINATLAEVGLTADNESITRYETRLAERE
jgi:CopG family transcriptional regulator / antitoxin EndoAI